MAAASPSVRLLVTREAPACSQGAIAQDPTAMARLAALTADGGSIPAWGTLVNGAGAAQFVCALTHRARVSEEVLGPRLCIVYTAGAVPSAVLADAIDVLRACIGVAKCVGRITTWCQDGMLQKGAPLTEAWAHLQDEEVYAHGALYPVSDAPLAYAPSPSSTPPATEPMAWHVLRERRVEDQGGLSSHSA